MCLMAMARNALKPAARRAHRTTKRRYVRWHHATGRAAWPRGTSWLSGLRRGGRVFHPPFGIWARLPPWRSRGRSAVAASPGAAARTWSRCRGRPGVPVRRCRAASSGMTWARSAPVAGIGRGAHGRPAAAVRRWLRRPCRPEATPSAPPGPGGQGPRDGAVVPLTPSTGRGASPQAGWLRGPGPRRLPAPPPPRRGPLGRPWGPAGAITPEEKARHRASTLQRFTPRMSRPSCPPKKLQGTIAWQFYDSGFQIRVWQSRNRKRSPWLCLARTPPLPEGEGE
jgi:hypothetical protein